MPVIPNPGFHPPPWLRDPHWQTIWPTLFRRVRTIPWRRERLELWDGDFLDLDWWEVESNLVQGAKPESGPLVILAHGLEGNSQRPYMAGMARAFHRRGWNVLSWNFRGCSGVANRLFRSYHSGATEDLSAVVQHAERTGRFGSIAVIGFSLGGNLTLKYLTELGASGGIVRGGAGVSVPCDLEAAAERMTGPDCAFYMKRFLKDMGEKMRAKALQYPGKLRLEALEGMTTFRQFDDAFTAPLHGFRDAQDYWDQSSCGPRLHQIRVPTMIVNAVDDPFLAPACFPSRAAEASEWVHLVAPARGGHVGFVSGLGLWGEYWSETVVADFLTGRFREQAGAPG